MKKIHFRGFFGKTVSMGLFVFVLLMTGCGDGAGGSSPFAGGNGTPGSPWQIETVEQLAEIRNNLGGYYVLNADIDLSSYGNFDPIGTFEPASEVQEDAESPKLDLAFTGIFDGNGHKISNVVIVEPTKQGVGLFGCVAGDNGAVKNLVVEHITITAKNETGTEALLIGGIIGYAASANLVEHITLQGTNTITGSTTGGNIMVGGIVGGGFGDIKYCSANADIILTGPAGTGGVLAGAMEDGSFVSCNAKGSVTVTGGSGNMVGIGGLAACGQNAREITDCTADVTITINSTQDCIMIGGLLGYTGRYAPDDPTVISGCTVKADITVPASTERVGGLVGSGFYSAMFAAYASIPGYEFLGAPNRFAVKNCSTSGNITAGGNDLVGTIAGYIYDNSTVEGSCTSTMTINNSTGDLIGGDKNSAALDSLK
jgi:hypothetical protein